MIKNIVICSVCVFVIACNNNPQSKKIFNTSTTGNLSIAKIDTTKILEVSLIRLIANPEKFNGQKVRVIGYLHLGFEDFVLCLHKEDYIKSISKNGVWVDIKNRTQLKSFSKYSDHYVLLEGIFDSQMTGHMGMNSGSIQNISRLQIWE